MFLIITIVFLVAIILGLVGEIFYLRRLYNFIVDKYDGLANLSKDLAGEATTLSEVHAETLKEYGEILNLTQQLFKAESVQEVEKIADKMCVLIETGVTREYRREEDE